MAPIGGNIEQRPEHERPEFELRMRQDKRPDPGPRQGFAAAGPIQGHALIVEDIEVKRAWAPGAPPSPPGLCLDLLQEAQQGRRRQAGGKQRHLIDVRRLARRAHGSRLVEVGHGLDRDASPLELAKRPLQGLGRAAPWPGRIGTKPYQDFPVGIRLRIHPCIPMFPMQPRAALPEGRSFLASILLTIGLTMHFYPTERVALFIDGANLYATAKSLGFDIDYKRLLALFGTKGQLIRALYYTALAEEQEYSSIRPLIDWLDYNGYTMVTKRTKEFTDATGRRKLKGNMDIELAVDAMELSEHLDHIVLFSGDGDFRSLVEALQHKGKRVSVVSTLTTTPPMVADELRRQADQFIDLAFLQEEIGRDPFFRVQREPRRRQEPDVLDEFEPGDSVET